MIIFRIEVLKNPKRNRILNRFRARMFFQTDKQIGQADNTGESFEKSVAVFNDVVIKPLSFNVRLYGFNFFRFRFADKLYSFRLKLPKHEIVQ